MTYLCSGTSIVVRQASAPYGAAGSRVVNRGDRPPRLAGQRTRTARGERKPVLLANGFLCFMLSSFCGQFRLDRRYLMPNQRKIYWRVAHRDFPRMMRLAAASLHQNNCQIKSIVSNLLCRSLSP